jgi:predicted enzyme related to lactoylglutathione lyase
MDGAKRFCGGLLDWTWFDVPSDCARAAEQAAALRGSVIAGPTDVPEVGRFALLADACDAVFAVFQAPSRP